MNITPDMAAKVLDADLRNIIKKVSDGGVLSASERAMLQNCAVPGGEVKARRAAVLLTKYAAGSRLSAGELGEIREVHPDFLPEAVAQEASEPLPLVPKLHLTPEAAPSQGDTEISRVQLDRWSETYGTQHRQLRRWIARGRERNDPCPLDDPEQMPIWWERNMEKPKRAPDKVLAAAESARVAREVTQSQDSATNPPDIATKPDETAPPPAKSQAVDPLDLASVEGLEGQAVVFFRKQFAGTQQQLSEAYLAGNEVRIKTLDARLESVGESLRKHEIAAEAKAKRSGQLLDRAEVFREVTTAINALKLMRKSMADRILAEMTDLTPDQSDRLRAVIENIRGREEDVLRNLPSYKTLDDVLLQLVA